ncbi:class I adenylate-forming enzyme family protein [Profundibacterium mesophilum]|uniref:4-coumarate--CoA ligase n=1 Tax=Profundibacterium mesophilum KAUST100406-0324 TaxID=1037889 RepID=A0A921TBP8_9RHOB|nr:class I adenylate-forming enzyme family protein [Profundibacterium mesophilum]KAF0674608.1 4-coumarate--CoA ligase [Profundibacterium mesophilum KAUST100406-0324]
MPAIIPEPVEDERFTALPDLVRAHAAARPGAPALRAGPRAGPGAGAECLSWHALAERMEATAARLRAEGLARGDVVASLAGVTAEHVILYLAVLAAGGCMAPLPITAHPDAIERMIANCAARRVLADDALTGGRGIAEAEPLTAFVAGAPPAEPCRTPTEPDDPFDIIYSSGTTGAPKGIEHSHRFRSRQTRRLEGLGIDSDARALVSTPIYSNTTLALLLPVLAAGGCLDLMEKFEAGAWLSLAEQQRVTHAMLVPVQYRRILEHPDFAMRELSAFRAKLCTSAMLPAPLIERILDVWPGRLINIYGMTEGGVGAILDCGAHPEKLHTVGRPVAGTRLRIVGEDGTPCAPGETGEIVGRSITMMSGYRGDPERTREALWTAPDGQAFIRSGDTGHFDADGFLVLRDRRRDVINSGGFNVFPADLEAVLSAHPAIAEAAVIGIPSSSWGETPLALVVPKAGQSLDPEEVRAWANARLGKVQRLCRVELRAALPRSDIGKLLKRELRAPYWSGTV